MNHQRETTDRGEDEDSFPRRSPHVFVEWEHHPGACGAVADAGVRCGWPHSFHRWPCSSTCTHDDAANPGHPERVQERSEAFRVGSGIHSRYEEGAEAMRAACWEAAQEALVKYGSVPQDIIWRIVKAAIEGATP